MKISKYFSASLFATMALSLCLGFASCSDDKDDEQGPVTPTVKMVPTKVVSVNQDEDGTRTTEHEYTYNDKLQIVKTTDLEDIKNPYSRTYTYDSKDRLATGILTYKAKNENGEYTEEISRKTTYEYDEKAGTVTAKDENSKEDYPYYIDDKGYQKSYKISVEDKDSKNTLTKEENRTYDKYRNLTAIQYSEINTIKDADGKVIQQRIDNTKGTASYAQVYTPFAIVTSPRWAMDDEFSISDVIIFPGLHLATAEVSAETRVTKDEDGKESNKSTYEATTTYKVAESKDNYPTKIIVTKVEKNNEDGKTTTSTSTTTLTITYKTVK